MGREKNRVSRDEARRLDEGDRMDWRTWERRAEMVWKVNGWSIYRERVIPTKALTGLGLPRPALARLISVVNKVNRRKGWADLYVAKNFRPGDVIPEKLYEQAGPGTILLRPRIPSDTRPVARCAVAIHGMVECKTGAAEETEEQDEWMELARLCPGMFAYTARPSRQDEMVELAGGRWPVL